MITAQFMTRDFKICIEPSILKVHGQLSGFLSLENLLRSSNENFSSEKVKLKIFLKFCEHSWHDNIKIESASKA